ncbi:MAG: DNA gyrase subunit A [Eubacteriales bacterium]|nr:DNA gyrase subunit A [Eubacteriales bacterium]
MPEKILRTEYSEEMQKSYISYSMSVITSRAIPDIRDGLKPVQRRVLYDMNELGVHYNKPTLKSARICGDTMGKYHPHGDTSIYDTLVVMAQNFKRNQAYVIGQGNFGSIEGDDAAAQRYTEAKLSKFTDDVMLQDLDKTVDYIPNYDEKLKEPVVLPARMPMFLLNGAEGIAVGMSTSVPSHNLGEICDLIIAYIKNPKMTIKSMLKYIKGPDFPTGGIVSNMSDLPSIYETGIGKIKLRGKIEFEKAKRAKDKDLLVVTEIPYTMIGSGIGELMSDIAKLCEDKKILDITDIYNHSSEDGIRIVMELKKDADIEKITKILYKKTKLENTFPVNMLAIVDGRPENLNLKSVIDNFLAFQYEIIEVKYKNLLNKEEEKKEVQEGLIKAVDLIDAIIAMLRGVKSREDAKACLTTGSLKNVLIKDKSLEKIAKTFSFTFRQADAILDMRLYKLIGLELLSLQNEYKETLSKIKEYKSILKDKNKASELIIDDIHKIKKEYAKPRRTFFEDAEEIVIEEEKIPQMDIVFTLDKFGYCKSYDMNTYEKNKDTINSENKYIYQTTNTNKVLLFSSKGYMYQIKLEKVPMCKMKDKGKTIDNLSKFSSQDDEIIYATTDNNLEKSYFIFVTKFGLIKAVETIEYDTNQLKVSSTKLNDNDEVVMVSKIIGEEDIVFQTNNSYFLRIKMDDVPLLKKGTKGVKGISLGKDDFVKKAYILGENVSVKLPSGHNIEINRLSYGQRANKGNHHK